MPIDPILQAQFERNLAWKRSWPRCLLGFISSTESFVALVILLTEAGNVLVDFWHTNLFGGVWTSFVLFINIILIYSTVCCITTIGASTCAFMWNLLTLLTLAALIALDIIFIMNPTTCWLTPTCSEQPQVVSLNYLIQMIPIFKNYTPYDSKKLFLEIQLGCAGVACIISFIYIITYIVCKIKVNKCAVYDHSVPAQPPQPQMHPGYPVIEVQKMPWVNQTPNAPYAPY
ncbi:unnamed protein product [Rotaria magnacalcarata]